MTKRIKKIFLASYMGYITQAIVNNFAPLLFLTFAAEFNVTLEKITALVTLNFGVQLAVDLIASKISDKIGYKPMVVAAHIFSAAGLAGMGLLTLTSFPFEGLLVSSVLYAIGGGLIEVMISPIVEACPVNEKSSAMSLLHSFYCWGQVFVVLISTLFFFLFGTENWRIMAFVWALLPLFNALFFSSLDLYRLEPEGGAMKLTSLFKTGIFRLLALLMVCAGASEMAMSQWASAYAQMGLGVSLEIGNLAGPCLFAVLMGSARAFYAKFGGRINLMSYMIFSCILCVIGYLLACFSPLPALGFAGCALTGLSVGIMWPGVFSIAGEKCPSGGTGMFALLALAGDLGCMSGPTAAGLISGANGDDLKTGLAFAVIFPLVLAAGTALLRAKSVKRP
ncbi:MAG: MFS transporter [Ruminococcaceae bacterium]|nr:MFS transporter [Oscillospiraceae bacterium]